MGEEPGLSELFDHLRTALDRGHPGDLLSFASSLLADFEPPGPAPFGPVDDEPDDVTIDDMLLALLEVDRVEITALLTAVAELLPNELRSRRIRSGLAGRDHRLPAWLTGPAPLTIEGVVEMSHVLRDGDTVIVGARTANGDELAALVYIDHNLGTVVKDAFVAEESLTAMLESLRARWSAAPRHWSASIPSRCPTSRSRGTGSSRTSGSGSRRSWP